MFKKALITALLIFLSAFSAQSNTEPRQEGTKGHSLFTAGKLAVEEYRVDEAVDLLTRAIETRGLTRAELAEAYYHLSRARYSRCELAQALRDVERALELNPRYADAYLARGDIMANKGEYKKAIDDFTRAIEFEPCSAKAHFATGDALRRLGDPAAATANCDRAIELDPELAGAYVVRGYLRRQTPDPENPGYTSIENFKAAHGDFNRAIELASSDIKANPRDAQAYFYRATAFSLKFKHQRALEDFSKVIELIPRYAYAYKARGKEWKSVREYQKAVEDHTRAIEILPGYARFYAGRGCALISMGEYGRAVEDFTRAIDLQPDNHFAFFKRGVALAHMADYARAVEDLTRAIELKPNAFYYEFRGRAHQSKGEFDSAVADYKTAMELMPNGSSTRILLARLRATCPDGRYRDGKSAVKLAEEAIQGSCHRYFGHLDTLAAAYAEAGRFNDAVNAQQEAIELLEKRLGLKTLQNTARRREASYLSKYKERLESYKAGRPFRDTGPPNLFGS